MDSSAGSQDDPPSRQSLSSRVLGVLFSPRETFNGIVAAPRWLGMVALVSLVTTACAAIFLASEIGQQAMVDRQVESMEAFGIRVSDEQYQELLRQTSRYGYLQALSVAVTIPAIIVATAGLAFLIFNVILGGEASFKQVLAVVAHAGVITILQQLFLTPLNYARQSMSSATNLAVFFPMIDESTLIGRVLGLIDLFIIWWLIVLAIGLGVLYQRSTGKVLRLLLILYGVIVIAIAATMTSLAP